MRAIEQLEQDLLEGRVVTIKVFNLGENLGADFAYLCHFRTLRTMFQSKSGTPPYIKMFRSNVDETNAIGFGDANMYLEYFPTDIHEEFVKQRYIDGKDWVQKINNHELDILSDKFRNTVGFTYFIGYGIGEAPQWKRNYPEDKWITIHELTELLHKYADSKLPSLPTIDLPELNNITDRARPIGQWSRMALEYKCFNDPYYPFAFADHLRDRFKVYNDYIYVSLRKPDHVRWYYNVQRQFDVLLNLIRELQANGHPAKIVFTLKDGELENNFNMDQSLSMLKQIQDEADDVLFHYCWTANPRPGRLTESHELDRLKSVGITNVIRTNIWEALALANACKCYLSEPAGFAEIITVVRRHRPDTTFLFPSSSHQLNIYVTRNQDDVPVKYKVNPLCFAQAYTCTPHMGEPNEQGIQFVSHWMVKYADSEVQIGDNCHGDDWKYFLQAHDGVFFTWYNETHQDLVNAIVEQMLKD